MPKPFVVIALELKVVLKVWFAVEFAVEACIVLD